MRLTLLAAPIFLLISFSPYHYWDEYFYLFSVRHHSVGELLELEPGLDVFPKGFFSAKLGFIVFLRMIVQAFGDGYWSLIIIQFVFAMMMLGFMATSYGLLREIFEEKEALHTTIVLIFLPISIYFGYKVLSEVPSLLFITLGSWGFLRSFQAYDKRRLCMYLILSIGGLFIGVVCRFVSILFFVGLILSLLVLKQERYPWKNVLMRASLVSAVSLLILMGTWISIIGMPTARFSGLIMFVTGLSPSLAVKMYSLAMSIQLFLPALLLSVKPPYDRKTLSALVWTGMCTLPFIISSRYLEPRFFYMALVPLAILTSSGLQRLAEALRLARYQAGKLLLLSLIVLGNWWGFASLMPYEIDQHQYAKMMTEIRNLYQAPIYLIPWLSDYGFLRFAFPEQPVKLTLSEARSGRNETFQNETFHRWAGNTSYVDSLEQLSRFPPPWIYVGWTYNPVVLQLKKRLDLLGIHYIKNLEQSEKLANHLTQSWVWSHPNLALKQAARIGPYYAFEVQISQ